ncbi:type VI secretion system baseplate subunit TssF [Huaxiibacter chinensis]
MSFEEKYYREELDYLRQLGKLLAREKPHLANFLTEKEGDPDVERLLEAFAFMSGRLRQKLEDEFPEFTHGLIRMLWANYLRPVPAMTVIAYEPEASQLKTPVQVCRNELISTRKVRSTVQDRKTLSEDNDGSEPLPVCHFTLARDLWLQPLRIQDIRNASSQKEGVIDISFATDSNVSPDMLDLNKVSFWLANEDDYTRHQLYLWFCECLMDAELIAGERHLPLPDLWLDAAGFESRDALLPWPKNVHSGYRVLQEYFCYPEAFFFFHLRNVATLPDDFPVSAFTLRLHFNRPLSADIKLRRDSMRLHCSPAINLFTHYAEPVRPDGRRVEYPLRASNRQPDAYDIFQISAVTSKVKSASDNPGSQIRNWPEFESFQHQVEYSRQREVVYWHHRTKTSLFHRGLDHTIAFIHADGSLPDGSRFNDDIITTSLICTNRMLPTRLHTGDICVAVNKNPAVASFHNVTRPTQPLYPVTDGDMHWSLISAMNLNYLSLLDRETLIQILRTFDLPGVHHPQRARLSRQKLDAIEKLETKPVDRLFKGVPVRGLATTLWIRPDPFACEGEIYLLGTVLSHFFALYASINSYHCLKIINTESRESWEWQEKMGQHALI